MSLVCCAPGGPVNVDEAVAELTLTFALMPLCGIVTSIHYLMNVGRHADSVFESREFNGAQAAGIAAAAVARLVAGEIPDHLVNPEIAARKEAAS
jgi:hypothetical protein